MLGLLIGSIRVCARWVSQELLGRLTGRSQGPNPPARRELIEDFCRALSWCDAKGRLCISSASVALRRLEKQGKVQLPPVGPRAELSGPRGLLDDDQALPPLPKLPARAEGIGGLRLRLIQDDQDPCHRIWNRLIVREHPLGRSPLVGTQLRYLVESDLGIVGAFGLGPPAFHLECRDQWIGWSLKAREQNRVKVIGLSRFLIRKGLSCPNLASRCYGLVLGQVAEDWLERYGIKPVLVETYVDRQQHQGRSLAASNWRRLGQSKGRGRDDQRREKSKSVKDVWVYELEPKARMELQVQGVERIAARSVFAPEVKTDWVDEEMDGVELGDKRLNQRVRCMLRSRWTRPESSFHRSFGDRAQAKGAYYLVENKRPEINLESLLAPHELQTARRMAAEKVVLMAQDTTTLSYNQLEATEGLGPVGEKHSRGMFLHSMQAFRLDGIPLGTAWAEVWARAEASQKAKEPSEEEKESARWVRALQAAADRARQMPQTQVIACGDRECDLYELYDQIEASPQNLQVLVRGKHDRYLTDGTRLMERLEAAALGGTMKVEVPRREGRPARVGTLELSWMEVEIAPPAKSEKKTWSALKLYAILAREVEVNGKVDPIEWVLLTTWPVKTLKMARRIVRWYALRWGIECWHKVLKEVCRVERRQMKSIQGLERTLALDMIVASRVLLSSRLGKEHPEFPASIIYSPEELEILEIVKKKEVEQKEPSPKLTIAEANIQTAMLAGFWGRKGDGNPGPKVLSEGMRLLHEFTWFKKILEKPVRRCRRRGT